LATVLNPPVPRPSVAPTPVRGRRDVLAARAILAAAGAAVAALLISRLGYVPMWDGFVYAEAINAAATPPFHLGELRFAGHASQAYAALLAAAQALAPGSYWPILVVNAVLLGVASVGFHRLLRLAFPSPEHRLDRALLTAAFTAQPTLLAAVVQPGLDLPLVPGFIWCTVLLLERRWVATVLVGIALAFTKETGALLYAVLLASYAVWVLLRTPGGARERVIAVLRLAPLTTPGVLFALYLLYRTYSAPLGEPVVWDAGTAMIGQSLLRQLIVPRIDRHLASYLALMLILNFAWVATAFTGGGFIVAARRAVRGGGWRNAWRELVRLARNVPGFLMLLTLATAYALTRFASYANSRYLLPAIALLLVPFLAALLALPIARPVRHAILGAFAVALLVSTVRTVDPIARALYGTFAFGEHEMLRMTSITHECCGPGRDQLVYNLEFTTLEALTSDALAAIRPGDSTLIVVPDSTNWYVAKRLDPVASRRTLRTTGVVAPLVVETDSAALYLGRGSRAYYVALPNGDVTRGARVLAGAFVVRPERRFGRAGYWLSVYPLAARPR